MDILVVECLRCGRRRAVRRTHASHVEPATCTRCGYLGWAESGELNEVERRALRERPVEGRPLRPVA